MFPRKGSAIYSLIKTNGKNQKRILKKWKRINRVVVFLYHLGVIPIAAGNSILLLYTKGRKTGKVRSNPLEYRKRNGIIHIFAARGSKADWLKNLIANTDCAIVKVKFRSFKPQITVLENIDEKEEVLRWYIGEYSRAAKFLFGWNPKIDDVHETDISSLVDLIQILQIREKDSKYY
jgi:deazaflavin-dependent oxidoreductase (nitroreductase family)